MTVAKRLPDIGDRLDQADLRPEKQYGVISKSPKPFQVMVLKKTAHFIEPSR
jgi:hypothetical protein